MSPPQQVNKVNRVPLNVSKVSTDGSDGQFNPFYSPNIIQTDKSYRFSQYTPSFPVVDWEPLEAVEVTDRGHFADKDKKSLLGPACKVKHLTPVIGTEIHGLDLRKLSDSQKDELALLVAERGVVFFRDQEIDIYEQLLLAAHFGPLHKHATTPLPVAVANDPKLEAVHVVYNDSSKRPNPTAFSKRDLWHTDVSYELQPPGVTSLKVVTGPDVGGDTSWSSGCALYSSLSPHLQEYLEKLTALHSAVEQADGARAAGLHVRREPVETVHPVVRVHPVTGWKSIYVNPGFTRRIVGVPKIESDLVLNFLFDQIAGNTDIQVRFKWEPNSIALWDNRIVTHSATFDFFPAIRHALRATPHAERPISVQDYEKQSGKKAVDRQVEIWKAQGIDIASVQTGGYGTQAKGYND